MQRVQVIKAIELVGKDVLIKGWVAVRRDHGQLIFLDIRDASGILQVVVNPKVSAGAHKTAEKLKGEFVVAVEGKIIKRPKNLVNPKIPTGEVELEASKIEIVNESAPLPFEVDDTSKVNEELRLKYRYLDLRSRRMAQNIRLRHKVIKYIRDFLDARGFVEIETPILTKATPEGARDFLVPSRLQPGKFYALPQSPQQYKQLLMVAGFEKYYQIARCFRDEDPRRDRSYGEFTQLDLEMSFATQDEILNLTEQLYIEITEKVAGKKVFQKPFPRFTHAEAMAKFGADKFDLRKKKDPEVMAFAWVVDFPLFEQIETRALAPSHHPFTAPKDEDVPLLDSDPLKVRSWQHDLVCNGIEIGGGSIRITNPETQRKVFKILGHSEKEIEEKFGHLLKAFEFGVPPHGGIAPGIDRLLWVLTGEESIREVTAFPMTASGQTAVMNAPSEVDPKQLKELHIKIDVLKKNSPQSPL